MSETLSRAFPVARKRHCCDSCANPIAAGEQYHRWTGTADEWDGVATLKECAVCFDRYGRHHYLNDENRALAEAWLERIGFVRSEG